MLKYIHIWTKADAKPASKRTYIEVLCSRCKAFLYMAGGLVYIYTIDTGLCLCSFTKFPTNIFPQQITLLELNADIKIHNCIIN